MDKIFCEKSNCRMIENNELDLKFKKKIFNLIMFFNKENTWHKKLFPDLSSFTQ